MQKDEIRKLILQKRLQMNEKSVLDLSKSIQEEIIKSKFWPQKGRIGLYSPVKNEVQTQLLFQRALESGLRVFFPRVEQGIQYYEVNAPDDLVRGSWSIPEPSMSCEAMSADQTFDLLIVPGLAFTKNGFRVGYGRGFYDRFISTLPARVSVLALAYDFQIVEDIPSDDWDQPILGVVTEKRWLMRESAERM